MGQSRQITCSRACLAVPAAPAAGSLAGGGDRD